MSDYEDEYMCNEDEDYDLEYSEDSNSEPDVDLENQVHHLKIPREIQFHFFKYESLHIQNINA